LRVDFKCFILDPLNRRFSQVRTWVFFWKDSIGTLWFFLLETVPGFLGLSWFVPSSIFEVFGWEGACGLVFIEDHPGS
jgi:hypothetical protein